METPFTLPPYASSPIGRAIIAEIVATRPEPRVQSNRLPGLFGGHREPNTTTYTGKPAAFLRRLHREWLQRELTALDRQFAITHRWDDDAASAIIGVEQPDDLIARVLAEAGSQRVAA